MKSTNAVGGLLRWILKLLDSTIFFSFVLVISLSWLSTELRPMGRSLFRTWATKGLRTNERGGGTQRVP